MAFLPSEDFFKLDLKHALACYSSEGIEHLLKNKQSLCLENIYKGEDVIANLPCGYGKSIIYHLLPKLLSLSAQRTAAGKNTKKIVLVICPLNTIQADQVKTLQSRNISTCRLDFSCNILESVHDIDAVAAGLVDIVHAHPEALFSTSAGPHLIDDQRFQDAVGCIVVDECHKIEQW